MMKNCLSALTLACILTLAAPQLYAQATATATGNALSVGLAY